MIGICALDTKARSKPMRNILNRLLATGEFEAIVFGDKVILDEEVEQWPRCDFLISFFSLGFPLKKAISYVERFQPFCLNDLPMQELLLDRRLVLSVLEAVGIPTPQRLVTYNGDVVLLPAVVEERVLQLGIDLHALYAKTERAEQLDSETIRVGSQTLKKPFVEKPVSGEDHNIYIYYDEEAGGGVRKLFRKVGNKSSEFFVNAEQIRQDGSFVYEQFMSVVNAEDVKVYTIGSSFAHAETRKSPVVDGLVRRNAEGKEIRYITPLTDVEKEIARKVSHVFGQCVCGFDLLRTNGKSYVIDVNGWSFVKGNDEYYDKFAEIVRGIFLSEARRMVPLFKRELSVENQWKLKAFLAVLRHGDRTPKQKLKFKFTSKTLLSLLNGAEDEVVLKLPAELKTVSNAVRAAMQEASEDPVALQQLSTILDAKADMPGTKIQLKPGFSKSEPRELVKIQIVLKWGGVFTHSGLHQSKDFGENLRKDLLIVNRTLLDDVKVYSSSESRVTATCDVFSKAFLAVSELPPDFIHVDKEMLDESNAAKKQLDKVKTRLQGILNPENPATIPPEFAIPPEMTDLAPSVEHIVDLLALMRRVMRENVAHQNLEKLQPRWCCHETPFLFVERWEKLFRDFIDVERTQFEPSKVSELHDSLKYDLLHNREFLQGIFSSPEYGNDLVQKLHKVSQQLFYIIGPHEYGIEDAEKLEIGKKNAYFLIKTLMNDLESAKDSHQASTRLYFTKESKVICLLDTVLLCGLKMRVKPTDIYELDYLTQIVFELHERNNVLGSDAPASREYSLRVTLSQGAHDPNLIDLQLDAKHSLTVAPRRFISDHISLEDFLNCMNPDKK